MKIWIVSMECAGIAEAGGVKNVTFSLCKELQALDNQVTLFIPVYKCNIWDNVNDLKEINQKIIIQHSNKNEIISFQNAISVEGNFSIVFVKMKPFLEKEDIYTYTANEQMINSKHIKGTGHEDVLFMDSLFAKAVAEYGTIIKNDNLPDIIHCQDASTALVPVFISKKEQFVNTKTVVTIHNAGPAYHHYFNDIKEAALYTNLEEDELKNALNEDKVEPFLLASNFGAYLTTVSETYAEELLNPENYNYTEGLSKVFFEKKVNILGITNGIDFERYNPENVIESQLPYTFNPRKNQLNGKYLCREYFFKLTQQSVKIDGIKKFGEINNINDSRNIFFTYHGRITTQKGISILTEAIPSLLAVHKNLKFIITGQGELELEKKLIQLAQEYNGNILFLNGYNREIARLTAVSGDFILLPSFFEPCGLEDFIAQIYGTIPIAHKTGGLNKIINNKTGFLYEPNDSLSLINALNKIILIKKDSPEKLLKMIKYSSDYVLKNYSWKEIVQKKYLKFFKEISKKS